MESGASSQGVRVSREASGVFGGGSGRLGRRLFLARESPVASSRAELRRRVPPVIAACRTISAPNALSRPEVWLSVIITDLHHIGYRKRVRR
jgi:hypothetical protein